jgi:hypothetical protein
LIVALPMAILLYAAVEFIARSFQRQSTRTFAASCLLLTAWTYYGLNTAFFQFAWPWNPWTNRTISQMNFGVCALVLTVLAVVSLRARPHGEERSASQTSRRG